MLAERQTRSITATRARTPRINSRTGSLAPSSLWTDKIGEPSENNGHRLRSQHNEGQSVVPDCRKDDGTWNDLHPRGSVVVDTMDGEGEGNYALACASCGYRPETADTSSDRHNMRINSEQMKY